MHSITLRRRALAAAVLFALMSPAAVLALPSPPDGSPFRVEQGPGAQSSGVSAMAADGRHAIAWLESGDDGTVLLTQLYTAAGEPDGVPVEVASIAAPGALYLPRIAMSPLGNWIVAWHAWHDDPALRGPFARMFHAAGAHMGGAFHHAPAESAATDHAISISRNGYHHAAAWRLSDAEYPRIQVRAFLLDSPQSDVVDVSEPGARARGAPVIAMGQDDGFVVAWPGQRDPGDDVTSLLVRAFDRWGAPTTGVRRISTPGRDAGTPTIASDAAGRYVVAWHEWHGADSRLLHVRLDVDGAPVGVARLVENQPGDVDATPFLATADDGAFSLLHGRRQAGGNDGLRLLRVAADDVATELAAPDAGGDWREYPTGLASDADGDLLPIWTAMHDLEPQSFVHAARLLHDAPIDLELTLDAPAQVARSQWFHYTLHVANRAVGDVDAAIRATSGFSLQLALPDGVLPQGGEGLNWRCEPGQPSYCDYLGVLSPGQTSEPLYFAAVSPWFSLDARASATLAPRHADDIAANDAASATTAVRDLTPAPFQFTDAVNVPRASAVVSDEIVVSGIDGTADVDIWGGGGSSYSINGGPWTNAQGDAVAGDRVRVRHIASTSFATRVASHLSIGDMSDQFTSTTAAADTVPDAFAFADHVDVARSVPSTSAPIVVSGIDDATPIAVTGGSYSINGGAFTTQPGSVRADDDVRVQHVASTQFATRTDTTLTVGGVADTYSSTTLARDVTPDAFAFASQANVARGSERTSDETTIGGLNDAAPISVSGGSYSIDGAAFTSAAGTIGAGQRLRLRHVAASGFATATTTTVSVGGIDAAFVSTTEAQDAVPAAFAFADRTGVATAVEMISAPVTVSGINVAAAVSVAGGSYSVNGGAFTTTAGSVVAGDTLRVRHVSASSANTAVTTTLTIGGVSDDFTSTTGAGDSTPNAFAFADVTGAKRNKAVISAPVTVAGINVAVPIAVSGGGARWSKNGGAYTSAAGSVVAGDVVRLQLTMPNASNVTIQVQVTIGGVTDTWSVTTGN